MVDHHLFSINYVVICTMHYLIGLFIAIMQRDLLLV